MGRLERRLKAANPFASNPSTKDREKAARKAAKQGGRRSGSARSVRRADGEGQKWDANDRAQDRKGGWYRPS